MLVNIFIRNIARRSLVFKLRSPTIQGCQFRTLPTVKLKKPKTIMNEIYREFHITNPNNAPPVVVVVLTRYAVKLGAMITGRAIRKWWNQLTPSQKKKVLRQIRSKKSLICFGLSVLITFIILFYYSHIVEDPVTKRRKFIMLNEKQVLQASEFEYQLQLQQYKCCIVPANHPLYRRVLRVSNSLILANRDLNEVASKIWQVTVIDQPNMINSFVLPTGKIFVFTGMLNICTNDDQLSIVLAHEMAHSILNHSAEIMSKGVFVEYILLIPTLIFWTIFPDLGAFFSDWIASSLAKLLIHLPFSRFLEREADVVGMQLAAKACFDVREAPVFWEKMKFFNELPETEWTSTHPNFDTRQTELKQLLPYALEIREKCHCPPLRFKLSSLYF